MPNAPLSQNTSFIPKQGPAKRTKQTATRQIHLLNIFAYLFFATTFLTSLGLFLFNKHLDTQLNNEVKNLNQATANFSDADMERVREFNMRLWQTKDRLEHTVSLSSVFSSLEDATSRDVMFDSLSVERKEDQSLELEAKMVTESFDSALFQRGLLERDDVVESVVIDDLEIITEGDSETDVVINSGVAFTAKISVPLNAALVKTGLDGATASVPLDSASASATTTVNSSGVETNASTTSTTTPEVTNNQESL